jgi:hypothetical protein
MLASSMKRSRRVINFHFRRFILVDGGDRSSNCHVLIIVSAANTKGNFKIVLILYNMK